MSDDPVFNDLMDKTEEDIIRTARRTIALAETSEQEFVLSVIAAVSVLGVSCAIFERMSPGSDEDETFEQVIASVREAWHQGSTNSGDNQ